MYSYSNCDNRELPVRTHSSPTRRSSDRPDKNVAEALQRISGIQITRNRGEGSSIAIRGLTQVRTEVNGRDSFGASGGRALSFEDVPSELLAGVDVYKNPSAMMIEGGVGGRVNLRTRIPFRSEEPTSELQSLMRSPFACFILKKKKKQT